MPNEPLRYESRRVRLKKATVAPDFKARTVLAADPWDYVDLWLRRNSRDKARFYWAQARDFAEAGRGLGLASRPLLAYYSMLNATKALLDVHDVEFSERHGVGGRRKDKGRGLPAELVEFSSGGVLGALVRLLGEAKEGQEEYNLKQLLYNLSWIHRAFCLTYRSSPELFVPLESPGFARRVGSSEAWFQTEVSPRDKVMLRGRRMPPQFEWDEGDRAGRTIRETSRFKWDDSEEEKDNFRRLASYLQKIRKRIVYVHSSQWLWYLKRNVASDDVVDHSSKVITFAAMHRLSELARYDPDLLAKHLDASYNWLLSEFITVSVRQFTDEIASEITGMDFMVPGLRE